MEGPMLPRRDSMPGAKRSSEHVAMRLATPGRVVATHRRIDLRNGQLTDIEAGFADAPAEAPRRIRSRPAASRQVSSRSRRVAHADRRRSSPISPLDPLATKAGQAGTIAARATPRRPPSQRTEDHRRNEHRGIGREIEREEDRECRRHRRHEPLRRPCRRQQPRAPPASTVLQALYEQLAHDPQPCAADGQNGSRSLSDAPIRTPTSWLSCGWCTAIYLERLLGCRGA